MRADIFLTSPPVARVRLARPLIGLALTIVVLFVGLVSPALAQYNNPPPPSVQPTQITSPTPTPDQPTPTPGEPTPTPPEESPSITPTVQPTQITRNGPDGDGPDGDGDVGGGDGEILGIIALPVTGAAIAGFAAGGIALIVGGAALARAARGRARGETFIPPAKDQ